MAKTLARRQSPNEIYAIYCYNDKKNEQRAEWTRPDRRLTCALLPLVCALCSAIMLVCAVVVVVVVVVMVKENAESDDPYQRRKHEKSIDFDRLDDNESIDDENRSIECGKSFFKSSLLPSSRIINGVEAVNHSFPWVVSLRKMIDMRIYEHFCAGNIIGEDTILTAAHCIHSDDVDYRQIVVVTGLHDRTSDLKSKSQVYSISRVYDEFDPSFIYEKDFALLKLSRRIQKSQKVWPICLSKIVNNYTLVVGSHLLTAGWGDTSGAYSTALADRLQQTMRRVVDNRVLCSFGGLIPWRREATLCTTKTITATVSSSNNDEQSVCMGDSGGPLMSYDAAEDKWFIEGVTSYVIVLNDYATRKKKCDVLEPNFFTFIPKYRDRIAQFL